MPDYGWKLGLIFFAFVASVAVLALKWPPKLGIDLSGGAMMVYEIDKSKTPPDQSIDTGKLIEALLRRINPSGVKEVTLRPYGINQIEVLVPNVNSEELAQMKSLISRQGSLEFRILANDRDHKELVKLAKAEPEAKQIRDSDGDLLGWWVPLADKGDQSIVHDPENISRTREVPKTTEHPDGKITEVLVANDDYNVTGANLSSASSRHGHRRAQGRSSPSTPEAATTSANSPAATCPTKSAASNASWASFSTTSFSTPRTSRAGSPTRARSRAGE